MEKNWKESASPEEKKFLEKILGIYARATKQNQCLATDFYSKDWMQEVIIRYLGEGFFGECQFFGGYDEAERMCILFGYEPYYADSLPIGALKVEVNTGIGKSLTHRDYLGALLGLGIERSKVGDILIKDFGAFIILTEELEQFVETHLLQIGRYQSVCVQPVGLIEIIPDEKQLKPISGTVSSLRADAIFALAFGMSRSSVVKLLQGEKGKKNGIVVKSSDSLKAGDILTLQGYGKVKFSEVNGQTKKERYHIKLEKYI